MKTIYKLVTLLLKLLSYFLVIKIGELETRSVGHYSKSIDIFLSEKKIFPSKKVTLEIWFTNNFVANHFLLNKWREKLFILPNNKIINQLFFGFYTFLRKNITFYAGGEQKGKLYIGEMEKICWKPTPGQLSKIIDTDIDWSTIGTENANIGLVRYHEYRESNKSNRHGFSRHNPNPNYLFKFDGY